MSSLGIIKITEADRIETAKSVEQAKASPAPTQ